MTKPSCSITSVNNKAITLVQQGECKNAVKLFLEALSMLKSELCSENRAPCSSSTSGTTESTFAMTFEDKSPFQRVSVGNQQEQEEAASSAYKRYDRLLALNPSIDTCAPQQRDGTTACLLYNMALTEERLSLRQDPESKARTIILKKAANIYNMAFSAAQHWKRWTKDHPGYQLLCLAILNNLIGVHQQLQNADKVQQLHSFFQNTLLSTPPNGEIHEDEYSLFAKNLHLPQGDLAGTAGTSAGRTNDASSSTPPRRAVVEGAAC